MQYEFDVGEEVQMGVEGGGKQTPKDFKIRDRRQVAGSKEYQLNELSGQKYKGERWFSEDKISA